jgi:transposase
MVYRFLETLKTTELSTSTATHQLPHSTATTAVWLFVRRPEKLDEAEQEDLAAFCLANRQLNTTYQLVQDFLQMMQKREGKRLDAWLGQVHESHLPELQSFAKCAWSKRKRPSERDERCPSPMDKWRAR